MKIECLVKRILFPRCIYCKWRDIAWESSHISSHKNFDPGKSIRIFDCTFHPPMREWTINQEKDMSGDHDKLHHPETIISGLSSISCSQYLLTQTWAFSINFKISEIMPGDIITQIKWSITRLEFLKHWFEERNSLTSLYLFAPPCQLFELKDSPEQSKHKWNNERNGIFASIDFWNPISSVNCIILLKYNSTAISKWISLSLP